MEFAKTSKELRAEKEEEIRRRLLNWPDCFYRERDPEVRRSLLDEAEKEGLTPEENGIRRKIFELRYPKSGSVKDNFLKAWLDLRFAYTQKGGLFGGRNPKKVTKPLDEIGFAELGEDSLYRSLLYQELYHLGMLYASLCLEDKNYKSLIFGLGSLSEPKLKSKIGAEFRDMAVNVLQEFRVEGKYTLWTDALTAAYCDMFPDMAQDFV